MPLWYLFLGKHETNRTLIIDKMRSFDRSPSKKDGRDRSDKTQSLNR